MEHLRKLPNPERDKASETGLDTLAASLPTGYERKTRPSNKQLRGVLKC